MKSQDVIEVALKAMFLNDLGEPEAEGSSLNMQFILQTPVSQEMTADNEEKLLGQLYVVLSAKTFGELLKGQLSVVALSEDEVAQESKLPVKVIRDLISDRIFTNNVPIVLFKNLLTTVRLSFQDVERAIYKTFDALYGRTHELPSAHIAGPTFRKGFYISRQLLNDSTGAISYGKELYENKEALDKYMVRLNELLKGI